MALADTGPAPYAPTKAVLLMINLYRVKTIAVPITAAAIHRHGVEESLARRTLSSLKQLDLLDDDGNPTPTMKKIKVAGDDQFKAVLADWLREAYKPIFTYCDPSDLEKVSTQFRHYEPTGMRNRMVTLFLGLCAAADLIEKVPAMPRSSQTSRGTTQRTAKPKDTKPNDTKLKETVGKEHQVEHRDTPNVEDARARYVDLLLAKAAEQDEPPDELLDRIERALGIAPKEASTS